MPPATDPFSSMLGELNSIKSHLEKLKIKQEARTERISAIREKFLRNPIFPIFHEGSGDFSLNFEENSPNLEEKINKLGWNSLPIHLKLHCIEKLDFKSKIHVAMTSHSEKSIIGSIPVTWNRVVMKVVEDRGLVVGADGGIGGFEKFFDFSPKSIDNAVACISHVFRSPRIEILKLEETSELPEHFFSVLSKKLHIFDVKIDNFHAILGGNKIFQFFAKKLGEKMREIRKIRIECEKPINLLIFPNIFKIPHFQVDFLAGTEKARTGFFIGVLQNWIENDVPVGTRMLFGRQGIQNFGDTVRRVIGKMLNGTEFRIRKGGEGAGTVRHNKKKSILIREELVNSIDFISCVVIPTTLRASKYERAEDWYWRDY